MRIERDASFTAPPAQWEGLMAAAQAGDRRAYEHLLRSIAPLLRTVARRRLHDAGEAEDAVQDTLMTLHRLLHAYEPGRPLRPWLVALCDRRAVDRLRRWRRHATRETAFAGPAGDIPAPDADDEAERVVMYGEIRAMVAALPPVQRAALTLTKIEDHSLAEASARSGHSVGALKLACFRGVRALRRRLAVAA